MWATDLLTHFLQTIVFSFCCVCFGLFPSIDSDLQQAIGSRSSETSYYYYSSSSYSSCSDYSYYSSKSLTTLTTPPPPATTTTTPPNPPSKKAPLFFEQAPPPSSLNKLPPFQQGGNPLTKGIWVLWTSLSCKEIPWMDAVFFWNNSVWRRGAIYRK